MMNFTLGYHQLLEPIIQTSCKSQIIFLQPSFDIIPKCEIKKSTIDTEKFQLKVEFKEEKIKKPKRISKKKSNTLGEKVGIWDAEEHALFMEGYEKYGRNWARIAKELCTKRTRQQVRSHAQKFFRKFDME